MLLRFAILLIALWQAGTALVPHAGTLSGASATLSHLHATGDQLELAHNETACPACGGNQVALWSSNPVRPWQEFVHRFHAILTADDRPVHAPFIALVFTRGPPSLS